MELTQTVLNEISAAVRQVSEQQLEKWLACIVPSRQIFVTGEGRSGLMCKGFAMRLMHLGYQSYIMGETITPAMRQGDILVAVSGSGTSRYTLSDVEMARSMGATVIAVTAKSASPLAQLSDATLHLPATVRGDSGEQRDSVQLLGSLFDQTVHIVLDIATIMIGRRDHVTNDDATARHC